ncbi:CASP-like protein 1B2 [Bienertia sinuspersici]
MCRFFVVANALATLHNFSVLAALLFGKKIDPKGTRFMAISILDIVDNGYSTRLLNKAMNLILPPFHNVCYVWNIRYKERETLTMKILHDI